MSDIETTTEEEIVTREPQRTAKTKKGNGLWIVGILIGIAVAFGAAYIFGVFEKKEGAEGTAQADPSALVATVNNVEITRGELDEKVAEIIASYPSTPPDAANDAAFELQILDEIINLKLLVAKAEESGAMVTEEDIDTEITGLEEALGGADALQEQLAAAGLSMDDLRENMQNELLIRTLLDNETDIENVEVTDAEVAAFYEEATTAAPEGQEIPPLTEASEFIRAQLVQQKSAEIVTAYIDTLRTDADISIEL